MVNSSVSFSIGAIVFAKLKYYPHWPGKMIDISAEGKEKSVKYTILFFGDNKTANLKSNDLFLYVTLKYVYGLPKTDNLKNKIFNKALQETEAAIGSITDANLTTPHNFSQEVAPEETDDTYKIREYELSEDLDLETSLTLAAEASNALLNENNQDMEKQLAELENRIAALTDYTRDLSEKNDYLSRNLIKEQNMKELLAQAEEEKKISDARFKELQELQTNVSLKATKYKASTQDMIHTNISAGDMQMVECGTRFPIQLINGPPITAKIRKKNESIEDFFSNHIEEYKTPIERSKKSMEDLTLQEAGHEDKTKLSDPTDTISVGLKATKNIDRPSNKLDRLNHFLTTTNPDILVLTEHGLNNNTIKEACLINYILVSAFSREAHLKGIKVSTTNKKHIYILGVYRPPSESVNHTFATLTTVLNRIPHDNSGICLVGDLNIDSLDSSRIEKLALDDFLALYEITRLNLAPTRISSICRSSIDVVCTNFDHNSLKVDILCSGHSDHTGQLTKLNILTPPKKLTTSTRRHLNAKNLSSLKELPIL
ncbi:PC4 and SFRS1-interacting protein [Homalodisca vitripennis]|nr:PC4 and SFRS1-interacting protein [Homalodisca vitripennis]